MIFYNWSCATYIQTNTHTHAYTVVSSRLFQDFDTAMNKHGLSNTMLGQRMKEKGSEGERDPTNYCASTYLFAHEQISTNIFQMYYYTTLSSFMNQHSFILARQFLTIFLRHQLFILWWFKQIDDIRINLLENIFIKRTFLMFHNWRC